MTFKIILGFILLIIYEIINLLNYGIVKHKFAFGILKILIINTLLILVLSFIFIYIIIYGKLKDVLPPIIKTAAKVFMTPLKSPKFK